MPYKRLHPVPEEYMEKPNKDDLIESELTEPVPERLMDKSRYEGHYSICQKLRDMYHVVESPELKMECRIMMAMAKKMHQRLKWYRDRYDKEEQNG